MLSMSGVARAARRSRGLPGARRKGCERRRRGRRGSAKQGWNCARRARGPVPTFRRRAHPVKAGRERRGLALLVAISAEANALLDNGRIALLGDAAHPCAVSALKGRRLAIEDALTLAAKLKNCGGVSGLAFLSTRSFARAAPPASRPKPRARPQYHLAARGLARNFVASSEGVPRSVTPRLRPASTATRAASGLAFGSVGERARSKRSAEGCRGSSAGEAPTATIRNQARQLEHATSFPDQ